MLPPRLSSIFGGNGGGPNSKGLKSSEVLPTLKLQTDKEVYGPGDAVVVTIEIGNPSANGDSALSLLVERLSFEIKGIEKLDTQWFATQKPIPGSKQRRGNFGFYWVLIEEVGCSSSSGFRVLSLFVNWDCADLILVFQVNMCLPRGGRPRWFRIRLFQLELLNHVRYTAFEFMVQWSNLEA